mgnify:CR=1 FL=1
MLIGTGAKLGVNPAILGGLASNFEETIREFVGGWSFAESAERGLIEEGVKQMLMCKPDIALADFRACSEFDIRESVSNIRVPTLIIAGDQDRLTPLKWSNYLHEKIASSEIAVIKGAGHMAMMEKAEEVNNQLTSLMRKSA